MTNATIAPHAKGSTLRSTLRYVEAEHGPTAVADVLARLGEDDRARIDTVAPTEEIPVELLRALWDAVEQAIGRRDPGWPEKSGAYSIQSMGMQLYGGILKKRDPLEFLSQPVSLFRLYYQPGNMEVVEAEPGRAVLRLVGFPGDPGVLPPPDGWPGARRGTGRRHHPVRPPRPLLGGGRRLLRVGVELGSTVCFRRLSCFVSTAKSVTRRKRSTTEGTEEPQQKLYDPLPPLFSAAPRDAVAASRVMTPSAGATRDLQQFSVSSVVLRSVVTPFSIDILDS